MPAQVYPSKHPIVAHKLALLRDKTTPHKRFRELIRDIASLLAYEATDDLETSHVTVETPMGMAEGETLAQRVGLVPILRAGLGMVDGVWALLPHAQVWHIGLYRDEDTLQPVEYYNKLPDETTVDVCLVLDPMLATGGSAVATIDIIKRWGVKDIRFLGIIAAPEGVKHLRDHHPDVPVYVAAVDSHLNDIGYIVPGLGDAGDRQFSTV